MNDVGLTARCPPPVSIAPHPGAPGFVQLRRRSTEWKVAACLLDEFFDRCGLKLDEWIRTGSADVVKNGVHRAVYRLTLSSGRYYLKHYRSPRLRNLLLNLVRSPRAEREYNAACGVAHQGVPTFEVVAIGRQRSGLVVSDSFLITRAIEDATPLDELVQGWIDRSIERPSAQFRHSLATNLGKLVARLHAGGLIHRDLHAGNILVDNRRDDVANLWLIDPTPMSRRSSLDLPILASNLALLNNSFAPHATSADRSRFFSAYWQTLHLQGAERLSTGLADDVNVRRTAIKRVEQSCAHALQHCFRKNDRKWVSGNRRLIIADTPQVACRAVAGLGKEAVSQFCENPELLFDNETLRRWIERSAERKSAIIELQVDGKAIACRATMMERPTARRLPGPSGDSLVRQIWEGAHALLRRSLACPRPLLFVAPNSGKNAGRQYLVTEESAGTVPLFEYISGLDVSGALHRQRTALADCVERLAVAVGWMHASGINHTRLSIDSVFVDMSRGDCHICFWQLESVQIRRRVTRRQAVESLARLSSSAVASKRFRRSLGVRFLKRYLKNRFRNEWKSYWRQVGAAGQTVHFSPTETATPFPLFSLREGAAA
jgi:tRNA A-37 threonylcarbamoyl transferase component Bud32